MSEKYGIDDRTRFLVLYLDAHWGVNEILRVLNREKVTLQKWEEKTKKGLDIRYIKKGKDRKRKITEETENRIIQLVRENPEAASSTKIATQLGLSTTSVWKVLTNNGFRYKTFDNSIIYSPDEKMIRVDFCKKMLAHGGKLIYRTFFSDEMGIVLNKVHKTKAWQIPAEKIKRKRVTENVKLNVWGAISSEGATSLDIYETGMNGSFYQEVVERHKTEMEKLFPDGEFYFLQDNHPSHKMNENWIIGSQKLELVKMPKRSPDLNIIENMWSALKERVASDVPTNERELRASLLRNWEILTNPDRLLPYFEALHRRYIECVANEGEKIPI